MLIEDPLPQAYGNCQCVCHKCPHIFHCAPCCHPVQQLLKTEEETANNTIFLAEYEATANDKLI